MKMSEKIALRVLVVALLAVVGLVVLPGVSRAQTAPSALQVVAQEGSYSYHFDEYSELRTTNATAMTLCANLYYYDTWGNLYGCDSFLLPPFASLDDDCDGECYPPIDEGSIFIVSGTPDPKGNCNPYNAKPKAGLRSWLMTDDEGAVGVSAQDAMLTADLLRKLIWDCVD